MIWIITYSIITSIVLRVLIQDNFLYLFAAMGAGVIGGLLKAWADGAFDEK